MQMMPRPYLLKFADEIILDLLNSRFESNHFTNIILEGAEKENGRQDVANARDGAKVDHAAGHYSSFFITRRPPPADISVDDIGIHLLALFYRSVDDRLPHAMKKHGLDRVKMAFQQLDFWLSKWRASEKSKNTDSESMDTTSDERSGTTGKKKRKSMQDRAQGDDANDSNNQQSKSMNVAEFQRVAGKEDGSHKRMRKYPPEMIDSTSIRGSGTAQRTQGEFCSPPQPQCEDARNNTTKDGKDPEKGKQQATPRTSHVSASEQSARKAPLPPQPPQRLPSVIEKEKTGNRWSYRPASQAMNSDCDASSKQGSSPEARKKLAEEKGERTAPPEQNTCNAGISKASENNINKLRKSISPPQPQQDVPSKQGASPETRKKLVEEKGERKAPFEHNTHNAGISKAPENNINGLRKGFLPPQPQQGRSKATGGGPIGAGIFTVAKMHRGCIIGQKGITINDLKKRSGCSIHLNDAQMGQDCQIIIKGTREGIEMAKKMFRDIVEMGSNHPYAGGRELSSLDPCKTGTPPSTDSATQRITNSGDASSPHRGPPRNAQDRYQKKDPPKQRPNNVGTSKVSESEQKTGTEQGLRRNDSSGKTRSDDHLATQSDPRSAARDVLAAALHAQVGTTRTHCRPVLEELEDSAKTNNVRTDDNELSKQPSEQVHTKTTPAINENPPALSSTSSNNQWKCMTCTFLNKMSRKSCQMCNTKRRRWDLSNGSNVAAQSPKDATLHCFPKQANKAKIPADATSNTNDETTPAVSITAASNPNRTSTASSGEPLLENIGKNCHHDSKNAAAVAPRPAESPDNKYRGASITQEASAKQVSNHFDDVIDLTADSPPHELPLSPNEAPASNETIKRDDEQNDEAPSPQPVSPPASPIPFAKISNRPPSPRPKPRPISEMSSLRFLPDTNPIFSGSLISFARKTSCRVSFDAGFHLDGSGSCLDDALCIDVSERLKMWDPYWMIIEELGARNVNSTDGTTNVGTRTTACMAEQRFGAESNTGNPSSCASILINMPDEISRSSSSNRDSTGRSIAGYRPWGVKWGKLANPQPNEKGKHRDRFQTGDRRLIFRTLPLQRSPEDTKKRADCHLWPKGTFIQLRYGKSEKVLPILQRKQQSHADQEWKGISHPLDLTVEVVNINTPYEIKLCSKEVVENKATDNNVQGTLMGSYGLHVAICEYVAPDALYDRLMGAIAGSEVIIPKIPLRKAKKMAKEYLADQTVSILDSDDEGNDVNSDQGKRAGEDKSLTFSLLCNISKTAMQTPVRGRNCKHMQCFDLKNYLIANENLTGGRWRCGVCESFVNVRDLVHCGLFKAMLDDLGGQVSGARDRVSYRSDGTWKLKDENRLRYRNKRKNEGGGNGSAATKAAASDDVIELL